jgi:hypothetical protein
MQGTAWADGDRRALSGRLELLRLSWTAATPGSAEASYYTWIDHFDTFGLGANVPIAMGNLSDSLFAFVNGRLVTLRIPYPSGFFAKNVDGRIDAESQGWKGKGLWSTSGTRTMFHLEGGKQNRPKAAHFQLRPDPLAK